MTSPDQDTYRKRLQDEATSDARRMLGNKLSLSPEHFVIGATGRYLHYCNGKTKVQVIITNIEIRAEENPDQQGWPPNYHGTGEVKIRCDTCGGTGGVFPNGSGYWDPAPRIENQE